MRHSEGHGAQHLCPGSVWICSRDRGSDPETSVMRREGEEGKKARRGPEKQDRRGCPLRWERQVKSTWSGHNILQMRKWVQRGR